MKAEISEFSAWIRDTDPDTIKSRLQDFLLQSGFTVVGFVEHYFDPAGYSATWLLAESHLAVHTFPEENKCYVQLSSCNNARHETFRRLIQPELLLYKSIKSSQ